MTILAFSIEIFFQRSAIMVGIIALVVWILQSGSGKKIEERFITSLKLGVIIFIAILILGALAKGCDKVGYNEDCEDWCDCHPCR
jgi:hypothetical protein